MRNRCKTHGEVTSTEGLHSLPIALTVSAVPETSTARQRPDKPCTPNTMTDTFENVTSLLLRMDWRVQGATGTPPPPQLLEKFCQIIKLAFRIRHCTLCPRLIVPFVFQYITPQLSQQIVAYDPTSDDTDDVPAELIQEYLQGKYRCAELIQEYLQGKHTCVELMQEYLQGKYRCVELIQEYLQGMYRCVSSYRNTGKVNIHVWSSCRNTYKVSTGMWSSYRNTCKVSKVCGPYTGIPAR